MPLAIQLLILLTATLVGVWVGSRHRHTRAPAMAFGATVLVIGSAAMLDVSMRTAPLVLAQIVLLGGAGVAFCVPRVYACALGIALALLSIAAPFLPISAQADDISGLGSLGRAFIFMSVQLPGVIGGVLTTALGVTRTIELARRRADRNGNLAQLASQDHTRHA